MNANLENKATNDDADIQQAPTQQIENNQAPQSKRREITFIAGRVLLF